MTVRILHGDCRDVLRTLPEASICAAVTDPPYDLTNRGGGPHGKGLGTPFARAQAGAASGGFMGMKWDATGVAFDPETWRQVLRVLKPGAHLLAFGGTRTYHRMACAIEDAGFEIRDQLGWVYGSGFPKSRNGEWGGTALKPAWEPIVMARKALIGTVEANWRAHGTGALNIDGCRVDADEARPLREKADQPHGAGFLTAAAGLAVGTTTLGRWPANIIHDGSDEVLAAFPEASGAIAPVRGTEPSSKTRNTFGLYNERPTSDRRDGGGSAARFFYCAKADRADRNDGLQGLPEKPLLWSSGEQNPGSFQSANTKRAAQNNHPTVKPTDLMRYLCRLVTPPGGTVLDPFAGSGSTLKAAELEGFSAIGIELSAEYIDIARRRIAADAPLFAAVDAA